MRVLRILLLESGLAGILLLGAVGVACGPSRQPAPWTPSQGSYTWEPGQVVETDGVTVRFPDWLNQWDALRAEAVAEISSAGYPPGWTVVVTVPEIEGRPGVLASGETWPDQSLTVLGWREDDTSPTLLPSCDYEAANARCRCESGGSPALALIQQIQGGQP